MTRMQQVYSNKLTATMGIQCVCTNWWLGYFKSTIPLPIFSIIFVEKNNEKTLKNVGKIRKDLQTVLLYGHF